jgi:riboflavin synthase alpha subunit
MITNNVGAASDRRLPLALALLSLRRGKSGLGQQVHLEQRAELTKSLPGSLMSGEIEGAGMFFHFI